MMLKLHARATESQWGEGSGPMRLNWLPAGWAPGSPQRLPGLRHGLHSCPDAPREHQDEPPGFPLQPQAGEGPKGKLPELGELG